MIVAEIKLHSAIDGRTEDLGTLVIDNISHLTSNRNFRRGDYRARMYKKGDAERVGGVRMLIHKAKPTREAQVFNHARLAEPVQNLVAKALKELGYG